jgi:hypothetical protein
MHGPKSEQSVATCPLGKANHNFEPHYIKNIDQIARVSVQGVKSLGSHFACLFRGFDFYEVKKNILLLFFKKKREILLHFSSFL